MSKSDDDPNELKKSTNICQVCGDMATINNYGALSCLSCRTFFRRNAFPTREPPVCRYNSQCEVNMLTRKVCSACRLKKCLSIGMSPDLIRKEDLCTSKRKSITTKIDSTNRITTNSNELQLKPSEQMLIHNINYAFNTFSPVEDIRQIIEQLSSSSSNFQYHISQSLGILSKLYHSLHLFICSTPDFKVLTLSEQNSLIQRNMFGIFSFGCMFLIRQIGLFDTIENERLLLPIYGTDLLEQAKHICNQFHSEDILVKLVLIALAFSSNCYLLNSQINMDKDSLLLGTFRLLGSQNVYVELLWKYLNQHLNHNHAVKKYSLLIKQILDTLQFSVDLCRQNPIYQTFLHDTIGSNEEILVSLWGKI